MGADGVFTLYTRLGGSCLEGVDWERQKGAVAAAW